jgi:phosphoglycerate dehydrogenase-like enzyme
MDLRQALKRRRNGAAKSQYDPVTVTVTLSGAGNLAPNEDAEVDLRSKIKKRKDVKAGLDAGTAKNVDSALMPVASAGSSISRSAAEHLPGAVLAHAPVAYADKQLQADDEEKRKLAAYRCYAHVHLHSLGLRTVSSLGESELQSS